MGIDAAQIRHPKGYSAPPFSWPVPASRARRVRYHIPYRRDGSLDVGTSAEDAEVMADHEDRVTAPRQVVEPNAHAVPSGHDGYADARTAIASTNLDQYQGRGATVTRGTDSVCIEVAGAIVAMVRIPEGSNEAAERDQLHAYLTPTSAAK